VSDEREKILAALRAPLAGLYDAATTGGWSYAMHGPSVVILSEVRTDAGLVVLWYGHYRVSYVAQSGSDYGTHTVTIKETTFGPNAEIIAERELTSREVLVTERAEEGYDDDIMKR
jgi:hypothetical protein